MPDYSQLPQHIVDLLRASVEPAANGEPAETESPPPVDAANERIAMDTGRRASHARFGLGMMILGVFAAVTCVLPIPVSLVDRLLSLGFGFVLLAVGAWFVDLGRSTRGSPPSNQQKK